MRTEYGNFKLTSQNVIFDGGDDEGCSVYLLKLKAPPPAVAGERGFSKTL